MPNVVDALSQALRCLPGVGPRSSQRMAYYLLLEAPDKAKQLSQTIADVLERVRCCESCGDLCAATRCAICEDSCRCGKQLCVVERPHDVAAIEQSGAYKGFYFVLHGRLSPLDGIGPEQLNLDGLYRRCRELGVTEVIFALATDPEGEATVYYLMQRLGDLGVRFSQLARGVPAGGVLEFLDASTIGGAMVARAELEHSD